MGAKTIRDDGDFRVQPIPNDKTDIGIVLTTLLLAKHHSNFTALVWAS
jgi:hypothetical protein